MYVGGTQRCREAKARVEHAYHASRKVDTHSRGCRVSEVRTLHAERGAAALPPGVRAVGAAALARQPRRCASLADPQGAGAVAVCARAHGAAGVAQAQLSPSAAASEHAAQARQRARRRPRSVHSRRYRGDGSGIVRTPPAGAAARRAAEASRGAMVLVAPHDAEATRLGRVDASRRGLARGIPWCYGRRWRRRTYVRHAVTACGPWCPCVRSRAVPHCANPIGAGRAQPTPLAP